MTEAMQALPLDSPIMLAWEAHKGTSEYARAVKWARHPEYLEGSLWALFAAGYWAALQLRTGTAP